MRYKSFYILSFVIFTIFQFSCASPITDRPSTQLSAYYDLRNRSSYIQVTNTAPTPVGIHVQIFQSDNDCDELDFDDNLTPNDTVIYDLDDIRKNNGSEVPINLNDDSYGYVVITLDIDEPLTNEEAIVNGLIGNFRIIDATGYEYRTNMASFGLIPFLEQAPFPQIANFNTVDGAILSDVVGYAYVANGLITQGGDADDDDMAQPDDTVTNFDQGVDFDIFVYDMNEEPLSCDTRNFACGNVMNYGINEDYRASRGNNLLCPGGGLADPRGGFVSFENGRFGTFGGFLDDDDDDTTGPTGTADGGPIEFDIPIFVGLIGINNGNGTGSMDYWFSNSLDIPVVVLPSTEGGDTI